MLDYGYTPEVLLNNMELIGVDPSKIDALIVSHGHYRPFRRPDRLPRQISAACCRPTSSSMPAARTISATASMAADARRSFTDFGALDRRELAAQKVTTVLCETPTVIAGHAFTTGKIKRSSIERVLPQYLRRLRHEGRARLRLRPLHGRPRLQGKIVPDEHVHEHATCFNVKDAGLVVICSCGHVGIVNSVRQAQEVSGVQKVHAIVGGFHLGPAPSRLPQAGGRRDQEARTRRADPDALQRAQLRSEARAQMPDKRASARRPAAGSSSARSDRARG